MNFNIKLNLQSGLLGLIIVGLGILIYLSLQDDEPEKQYWEKPNFQPIRKKLNKTLDELDSIKYDRQIPAFKVYEVENNHYNNRKVINKNDSLLSVIDSLRDSIAQINKDYLTQYPVASKIIRGHFSKDSIRLDLLNIKGNISRRVVKTDYSNHSYGFKNNGFVVKKVDRDDPNDGNPLLSSKRLDYGIQGGYQLFKNDPMIGLNSTYQLKRFKWSTNLNAGLGDKVYPELRTKIIYNLE